MCLQELATVVNGLVAKMDMPTSSSTDYEEERLFKLFRGIWNRPMKAQGDDDQLSSASSGNQNDNHDSPVDEYEEHEHASTEHEGTSEDSDAEEEQCFALGMTSDVIQNMFAAKIQGKSCAVFNWKHAVPANTQICFVEVCQSGKVLGTAKLTNISAITTFAHLRANSAWKRASKFTQQVWRHYVVKEGKKLYAWNFDHMHRFDDPMQLHHFRSKCLWMKMKDLVPHKSIHVPELDLRETGAFFLNRLPKKELHRIKELCLKLHNKVITVGSTCSGTDICVNVVKATFQTLCKMFQVSRLYIVYGICIIIYIYSFVGWAKTMQLEYFLDRVVSQHCWLPFMYIYIYIDCFLINMVLFDLFAKHRTQVNIKVNHTFSVEIDEDKRNFILASHVAPGQKPNFHLFSDVKIFKDGSGYCYTCGCIHAAPSMVDLMFAGPSCKKLSKEFTNRQGYANCYSSGDGCSGHTYVFGVLEACRTTSPAVLFFENVLGVAETSTVNGKKIAPPITVSWIILFRFCCKHSIYIIL